MLTWFPYLVGEYERGRVILWYGRRFHRSIWQYHPHALWSRHHKWVVITKRRGGMGNDHRITFREADQCSRWVSMFNLIVIHFYECRVVMFHFHVMWLPLTRARACPWDFNGIPPILKCFASAMKLIFKRLLPPYIWDMKREQYHATNSKKWKGKEPT